MLTAIEHVHASGVLHRDLKPSNILIEADGQAVITDFGPAKILASDTDPTAWRRPAPFERPIPSPSFS